MFCNVSLAIRLWETFAFTYIYQREGGGLVDRKI